MSYDYSSESKLLELPNPYQLQNRLLWVCGAILLVAGVTSLFWARGAMQQSALRLVAGPLGAGLAMIATGLLCAATAARRMRFFFGCPSCGARRVAEGAAFRWREGPAELRGRRPRSTAFGPAASVQIQRRPATAGPIPADRAVILSIRRTRDGVFRTIGVFMLTSSPAPSQANLPWLDGD